MKRIIKLPTPPRFLSYAAVGGYEEGRGSFGDRFDFIDPTDRFGQSTWEMAEGEMGRCALNLALAKGSLSHTDMDMLVAGDLQNQCVASAVGLDSFGIPYIGVYGACSTCTESLLLLSSMLNTGECGTGAIVTTSHNAAAERQFRTPIEYGGQRAPCAQWTATAGGAFLLSNDEDKIARAKYRNVTVADVMVGKVIDGQTADSTNMGAAMSFAAADSIISYFKESGSDPREFDHIVTGDLGRVGTDILLDILSRELPSAVPRHTDCGLLIYDGNTQDVHSGGSGCGTSASILACHFLPLLEKGRLSNILFLSTGALMSPSSVLQGNTIRGIAPAVHLRYNPYTPLTDVSPS